jgi:hypothetical protein
MDASSRDVAGSSAGAGEVFNLGTLQEVLGDITEPELTPQQKKEIIEVKKILKGLLSQKGISPQTNRQYLELTVGKEAMMRYTSILKLGSRREATRSRAETTIPDETSSPVKAWRGRGGVVSVSDGRTPPREMVTLRVRYGSNLQDVLKVKLSKETKMRKLMSVVARILGRDLRLLVFTAAGGERRLGGEESPRRLGLRQMDCVEVRDFVGEV